MSNERNWNLLLLLVRFQVRFSLFFVLLFHFFAIVGFATTTLHKFQSQIRLPQVNGVNPIPMKVKLYEVLLEWAGRIKILFVGRQDIVNYWFFPSKVSRNCHKSLLPKVTRNDYWEMFGKKSSPTDWSVLRFLLEWLCLHLFPATTNRLFSQSLSSHSLAAAVLKFFLPPVLSAISGTANSN